MTAIRWGCAAWIAHYLVPITQAIAGKDTKASVLLQFFTNLPVRDIFCLAFGASGVGWGAVERHTRKKRIAELADHHRTLEQHIDSNRSTSGLTRQGETPRIP